MAWLMGMVWRPPVAPGFCLPRIAGAFLPSEARDLPRPWQGAVTVRQVPGGESGMIGLEEGAAEISVGVVKGTKPVRKHGLADANGLVGPFDHALAQIEQACLVAIMPIKAWAAKSTQAWAPWG